MKWRQDDNDPIPYVVLEYLDTMEKVLELCYEKGAVITQESIDKYNIMPYGRGYPELYTREQLEVLFPIPKTIYSDMPKAVI